MNTPGDVSPPYAVEPPILFPTLEAQEAVEFDVAPLLARAQADGRWPLARRSHVQWWQPPLAVALL